MPSASEARTRGEGGPLSYENGAPLDSKGRRESGRGEAGHARGLQACMRSVHECSCPDQRSRGSQRLLGSGWVAIKWSGQHAQRATTSRGHLDTSDSCFPSRTPVYIAAERAAVAGWDWRRVSLAVRQRVRAHVQRAEPRPWRLRSDGSTGPRGNPSGAQRGRHDARRLVADVGALEARLLRVVAVVAWRISAEAQMRRKWTCRRRPVKLRHTQAERSLQGKGAAGAERRAHRHRWASSRTGGSFRRARRNPCQRPVEEVLQESIKLLALQECQSGQGGD